MLSSEGRRSVAFGARSGMVIVKRAPPSAAFAASASSCRSACDQVGECDGREKALTAVPFLALLAVFGWRRYRTRTRTRGE